MSPLHRWVTRHALSRAGAVTATGRAPCRGDAAAHAGGQDRHGHPLWRRPRALRRRRHGPRGRGPDRRRRSRAAVAGEGFGAPAARRGDAAGARRRCRCGARGRRPGARAARAADAASCAAAAIEFAGEIAHEDVPAMLAAVRHLRDAIDVGGVRRRRRSRRARCGCPSSLRTCTASRTSSIDGVTGLLVPPADAAALADAIGRLAADPALRERMGDAGRAFVERHYDWRDNARLMEVLYGEMVATAP